MEMQKENLQENKQTTGRAPVGKPSTSKLVWANPQRLGEDFPISLQRKYWVIEFLFSALSIYEPQKMKIKF